MCSILLYKMFLVRYAILIEVIKSNVVSCHLKSKYDNFAFCKSKFTYDSMLF